MQNIVSFYRALLQKSSFAASVKKANIDSAVQKQLSVSLSDMPLRHNQWSKGKSLHVERFADGEHTICFENSDTPLIDHLVMREFVSGPPNYCFIYERVRDRKPSLREGS